MGFNLDSIATTLLRLLAWVMLLGRAAIGFYLMAANRPSLDSTAGQGLSIAFGLGGVFFGALGFAVLTALASIAENLIAIRADISPKDEKREPTKYPSIK